MLKEILKTISTEVSEVLGRVSEDELIKLSEKLERAERIFVAGTGRSGLIGKVFAMRMMHIGYKVFVVGETITPSIDSDDVLLIISGSGSTGTLKQYAKKARQINAEVVLMTTNGSSEIAEMSSSSVILPAATKKRLETEPKTIQPLGSQFDQSAHLLLDSIIVHLLQNKKDRNDGKTASQNHANLE